MRRSTSSTSIPISTAAGSTSVIWHRKRPPPSKSTPDDCYLVFNRSRHSSSCHSSSLHRPAFPVIIMVAGALAHAAQHQFDLHPDLHRRRIHVGGDRDGGR